MKYKVENFKQNNRILIGPLSTKESLEIRTLLQSKGIEWVSGVGKATEQSFIPCRHLGINYDDRKGLMHSFSTEHANEIISFETFMEHNKPVYRIKTREELLQVPGIILRNNGELDVPGTNTIVTNMLPLLGKEISKESFDTIMAGGGGGELIPEGTPYYWPKWAVTDEPLNVEERKVVAYKLVKEYPKKEIGSIVKKDEHTGYWVWEKDNTVLLGEFKPDVSPEWWEPVYEKEKTEIEVEVGTPKKKVRILKNGTYFLPEYSKKGTIGGLERLIHWFKSLEGFDIPYNIKVESVWVGCTEGTSIRKEDVDLILNTYKENFEK